MANEVSDSHYIVAQSMDSSFKGGEINLSHVVRGALHCKYTGTPGGTLKIQASNIGGTDDTDWSDLSGQSAVVSAADNTLFDLSQFGFKFVRLVFTRTSGTGAVLDAYFHGEFNA